MFEVAHIKTFGEIFPFFSYFVRILTSFMSKLSTLSQLFERILILRGKHKYSIEKHF